MSAKSTYYRYMVTLCPWLPATVSVSVGLSLGFHYPWKRLWEWINPWYVIGNPHHLFAQLKVGAVIRSGKISGLNKDLQVYLLTVFSLLFLH